MKRITLNKQFIEKIESHDQLYAHKLAESKNSFISIIRQIPGYMKLIKNEMSSKDVFEVILPKDIVNKLNNGDLERVYEKNKELWTGQICKPGDRKFAVQAKWKKANIDNKVLENLQMLAVQTQLAEISEMLYVIDSKINILILGQQSDRISQIIAGIQLYEQAYFSNNIETQKIHMSNALQSLNEGRTKLMERLKRLLQIKKRDSCFIDKFWKIVNVDKPEIDYFNEWQKSYNEITECLKYINLSSVYIYKIHSLLKDYDAAIHSKEQFSEFCDLLTNKLGNKDKYFPYNQNAALSIDSIIKEFSMAKNYTYRTLEGDGGLAIETSYEELLNEKV